MSTATETVERSEGREGLASMIRRVKIRNYKSIKNCDVELRPFTILVGRNGSGKSNFLDAIQFVSDVLNADLRNAVRTREGFHHLRRVEHPYHGGFSIALELDGPSRSTGYSLEVGIDSRGGPVVRRETLRMVLDDGAEVGYDIDGGIVLTALPGRPLPPPFAGEAYLPLAQHGMPEVRHVLDALTSMCIYKFSPESMRSFRAPQSGEVLERDGSNLAAAFARFEERTEVRDRLLSYLRLVVPEVLGVRDELRKHIATLSFEKRIEGVHEPNPFSTHGMSDGTLRALGILVAINQLANDGRPIRLVGIEEPETALHPAAAGALMDAFRDAASHTQVLVTTHGADLLDRFDPEEDHILAVEYRDGRTEIGPVNPASRDAIREHLFSAGELLRMDQLHPDRLDVARQAATDAAGPGGRS